MEECCNKSEASETLEQFEYWDGALHQQIAAAAHNSFVLEVFNAMTRVRSTSEWGALKRRSVTPERCKEYQHQHRILVAALKDRAMERARDATDRKSVVSGKSVSVRVDLGGRRIIKKQNDTISKTD